MGSKTLNVNKTSIVSPLEFQGDDPALVAAIRQGHVGACAALYDRYVNHVRRVLTLILGVDSELPDLTNEVFFQGLKCIHNLSKPDRLKAWLTRIAVFTARRVIRSRKQKKWLRLVAPEEMPEPALRSGTDPAIEAMDAVRQSVNRMPPDERIVFSLRYMEGMELSEIADATDCSLRTAKRRVAACERRFKALALSYPVLRPYLESRKWRSR